jgi:D-alanyl-D-alanine carboxypeptidase (penicillin-binding protein 5/6)
MATLLADWDTGSTTSFVVKMNASARALGLGSTTFTDPSGADPGTVSTPGDMIRLGEAAMVIPALSQIVAMPQVTLPLAGLVYNFDADLGQSGIVGIKTGSDSAAGGCFLFESRETVDGTSLTLFGAVLGQGGVSPNTTALNDATALLDAAFADVRTFGSFPSSRNVVGWISTPWGQSVPVTVESSRIIGWSGLAVSLHVHLSGLSPANHSGAQVGVLRTNVGGQALTLALRTSQSLHGPSAFWRLTRL